MDDHHSRMSGQSFNELRSLVRTRKRKEKVGYLCRYGVGNKNIKEAVMPLTFKPFINLAEAIALAKESGKPVLVKP